MNEEQFDDLCRSVDGIAASLVDVSMALEGFRVDAGLLGENEEHNAGLRTVKLAERIFVAMAAGDGALPDAALAFTLAAKFQAETEAFWRRS